VGIVSVLVSMLVSVSGWRPAGGRAARVSRPRSAPRNMIQAGREPSTDSNTSTDTGSLAAPAARAGAPKSGRLDLVSLFSALRRSCPGLPSRAACALLPLLATWAGCSALTGKDGGSGTDAPVADVSADLSAPASDASDAPGAPITCALLGSECGANRACYPYPFDSNNPTGTLCGLQGTGTAGIPCATQLDCDAQSICTGPGESSAICLSRCDPNFSFCAVGEHCARLARYSGVGLCSSF